MHIFLPILTMTSTPKDATFEFRASGLEGRLPHAPEGISCPPHRSLGMRLLSHTFFLSGASLLVQYGFAIGEDIKLCLAY